MGVKLDHIECRILEALQSDRALIRRGLVSRVADEIWELTVEGEDFEAAVPAANTTSMPPLPSGDMASSHQQNSARSPRAFFSYSHDSPEHKRWVAALAARLVEAGIDAVLDEWDLDLGMDLAKFMERGVAEVDRVLVICTEIYVQKADAGRGGVGYETMIVTGELVQNLNTNKFIPLIRQTGSSLRPRSLSTRRFVDFNDDSRFETSFEELVRALHATPAAVKPPLGANPFSQPKEPTLRESQEGDAAAPRSADDLEHWTELLRQAKANGEWVECDSPLELDMGVVTSQGTRSTVPARLAGPARVARIEERRWFELGFPLSHQGGITMVVIPFPFVEAIWPGAEGRLHVRLNKTILFAEGKSTFV
ncbi:MAG: toll/interleukin-1 receptor domain-containing protein [Polyangiaceae bacterium]